MNRTAFRLLLVVMLLPPVAGLAFVTAGPERVYAWIAGPADQGNADFGRLERRETPTDSLACSADLCGASVDLVLPVYDESPALLLQRLDAVVLEDTASLQRVDDRSRPHYRRYVARTPMMRFADTIDAEARALPGGSGLMLYGRSQLGVSDWGVNRARQRNWAAALAILAPPSVLPPTS